MTCSSAFAANLEEHELATYSIKICLCGSETFLNIVEFIREGTLRGVDPT